jgi:hypothetical protein
MNTLQGVYMFRKESLIQARGALGQLLQERGVRFEAIVLGGANLLVAGVIQRPTIDVDVVARRGASGEVLTALPLPVAVADAVRVVAQLQGLPDDWFNSQCGSEIQFGLPEGCVDRLESQGFGSLVVWWVDRQDIIAFKLVAAVDHIDYPVNKHLADLRLLKPTAADLEHARVWFDHVTAPSSAAFSGLAQILEEFGHGR